MAKLGKLLKAQRTPEQEMNWKLNEIEVTSDLRGYNGLSAIGEKCVRKLQLAHYDTYTTTHSVRILRLFGVGHRMEETLRDALKEFLGIDSFNDQARVVGVAGHWKGHIDGEGQIDGGEVFLTEFKTHNDKSFKDLKKKAVQESKPMHYSQVQTYMGYRKLGKALYVAYNKNDSEIYIEWIPFDEDHFKDLQRKEGEVIMAETLLPRIGTDSPTWFECKLCDARKTCFGKEPIKKSCKNCKHVDILDDGVWSCPEVGEHKAGHTTPCNDYVKDDMFWELS